MDEWGVRPNRASALLCFAFAFDGRAFGRWAFGRLAAEAYDVISSRASPPARLPFLTFIHDPPALLDERIVHDGSVGDRHLDPGLWILEHCQPLTIAENENDSLS